MKFKFNPDLQFQKDAITSIVNLFEGQPSLGQSNFETGGLFYGFGNNVVLDDEQLLKNTHVIQDKNGIERSPALEGRNFSVEMETGTGKTYVYIRTLFELNKSYGFKKFIVVVPSVAIREGVAKSIDMMREHLKLQYDKVPFEHYLYDSKKITQIRNFRDSNNIQVMVMNIQSFQRDFSDESMDPEKLSEQRKKKTNVIYRDNDKMGGRPIDFIRATMPIVLIDEPQSVDSTPKSQQAIAQLNPAVILRYSATHRNPYNLLYKLGPVESYEQQLVKRIEIASIHAEDDYSSAYVKYVKGENKSRGHSGIRAFLEIHKKTATGIKKVQVKVKQFDDLYHKSGGHLPYREGFIVNHIDITDFYGYVKLGKEQQIKMGESIGGNTQEIMKVMVRETIEQHLKKELSMKRHGIKVLSLFFIDKVANYRIHNSDGTTRLGKVGQWFEECYRELSQNPNYKNAIPFEVGKIHNGYFSKDRKGKMKDTRGGTKEDESTYSLIMRDKEKLLDGSEPLRFIFSHTALREGWDNPNVFQICTLREVGSEIERRQQIGRGLRLPVNKKGERVHDIEINRLTVISSEGYEEYARGLQNEYEQDLGIKFGIIEKHHFAKIIRGEQPIGAENSGKIWEELASNGYIESDGKISSLFDLDNIDFSLKISSEFEDISEKIVDEIKKRFFKDKISNAKKRKKVNFKKQVFLGEDFKELWSRVSARTRYRIFFKTEDLITKAVEQIESMRAIVPIKVTSTRAEVTMDASGVQADLKSNPKKYTEIKPDKLPNIVDYLRDKTQLTRNTLVEILTKSSRLKEFFKNPYHFMNCVGDEITKVIKKLMLKDIQYKKVDGKFWEMRHFERDGEDTVSRYIKNLYQVKNQDKTLYDSIEFDSEVEKKFAKDLDNNEHVKFFVKLPRWFKIDTPVGPYNPDWAFVTEREEKLYFVRETKGTLDLERLRPEEKQKIDCGHRHFKEVGVDFDVATSLGEVGF